MAEKQSNLIKNGGGYGIVPDVNKPITVTQTFTVNQINYFTVPETGFYSFWTNNMSSPGSVSLMINIVDANNATLLEVYDTRLYGANITAYAGVSYMGFFEKDTRLSVYPGTQSASGFKCTAYKAKSVKI